MLNVRRNVMFSFVEVCTTSLLTFISYRVVVRLGGFQLLGIWSAMMAWLGLSGLGDLGLGGASTRFIAGLDAKRDTKRIWGYLGTAIISNFTMISTLSFLSYLAVTHWLVLLVGPAHVAVARQALPWMVCAVVSVNLGMIVNSSLISLHLGFIRSIIMISGNLLQLGLVVWLVPRYGLVGFATAQITQFLLATVVAWVVICVNLGQFRLPLGFRWRILREMLSVSLMLQAANISNSLFEPLTKVLVSHFGGMQMQGLFESAYKTVATARNVTASTAGATVPALTRYALTDIPQAQELYRKTRRNTGRVLFFIFGGIILGSPVISLIWFGAIHYQFVAFVSLLGMGCLTAGWCAPAYLLGQATGRLRGVLIATGTGDILLLLGGLAFGFAGMPFMIVAVTASCLIFSNLLVLRLNEPLIGLGRGASRPTPAGVVATAASE